MKTHVIDPQDLPFVEAVAKIMFCNPFLPERTALEQVALGADYDSAPRPWNVFMDDALKDPNLAGLVERVTAVAGRCRDNLARRGPASEREATLYFNFICFHVYYRYRADFDKLVDRGHESGSAGGHVTFFERSNADAASYLQAGNHAVAPPYPFERMFAFGFQVRRAFNHIFSFILGTSDAATQLRARVWQSIFTHDTERYVRSLIDRMGDVITLVTGPSGSGKELVARAIGLSRFIPFDRSEGRFRQDFMGDFHPVNLSALAPLLIESELFGHRKGAFTGALADHEGYLEACDPSGVVFLDEIGDVSPAIQVKLLRLLQTRRFHRLGDTRSIPFQGKIVAATNRDLDDVTERGALREDFYYRLCADKVETPWLRDLLSGDADETRYLVQHISTRVAGAAEADQLTAEVCEWIDGRLGPSYPWPGNFRELEQCVRNILVHREYYPRRPAPELAPGEALGSTEWTAADVLRQHVTRVYAQTDSLEESGKRLELDPRTVKKYVDRALLDRLTN